MFASCWFMWWWSTILVGSRGTIQFEFSYALFFALRDLLILVIKATVGTFLTAVSAILFAEIKSFLTSSIADSVWYFGTWHSHFFIFNTLVTSMARRTVIRVTEFPRFTGFTLNFVNFVFNGSSTFWNQPLTLVAFITRETFSPWTTSDRIFIRATQTTCGDDLQKT